MRKMTVYIISLVLLVRCMALAQPGVTPATYDEIQRKVDAIFGSLYDIRAVNNIDSGFVGSTVQNAAMVDPYGTLKGCFVFAAVGKDRDENYTYKGFIGVYKNNQIIWRSDTVINNEVARGATIAATMDLNKDGTVEIVSNWSQDSRWGPDYLWIFSWDGSSGRLLNEVDELGYSVIRSIGGGIMEIVDVDGDGIMEIKGFWSEDDNIEHRDSPVIYSWNGQLYGKWPTAPEPLPSGYLPRNKLSVSVSAAVQKMQDVFVYKYAIHNAATSLQKIDEVLLHTRSIAITNGIGREKWRFAVLKRSLMGWTNLFIEPNPIAQNETDISFRYMSTALPFITTYYVRGHNPTLHTPPYDEDASFRDKVENSVKGYTLGPADPPNPFVTSAFVDTLISYKHQAVSLGWIKDPGIATSLDEKLDNARDLLEKKNNKAAKNILQAFVNEVEAQKDKHLTSEAYALLKFNAEYLISKLTP